MRSRASKASSKGISLLATLLVFSAVPWASGGNCGVCQPGRRVACHSETMFSACVDGYPTYDYIHCPEGQVCSSEAPSICLPADTATPSCVPDQTRCGICNAGQQYACLDEHTVALCLGTDRPSPVAISYCPVGSVCDLDNPKEMCSDQTVAKPSCSADLSDPAVLCSLLAPSIGTFVENLSDTTCTTYVYCSMSDGVWSGIIGTCKTNTYYDITANLCKSTLPLRCKNAQELETARP